MNDAQVPPLPHLATDWFTQLVTDWVAASPMIAILLVLIGIDVLTGICAAFYTKVLSSGTSFRGMVKKVIMLALVGAGVCMEMLYSDIPWGRIIAMFFCFTELISITENAMRCDVPLPKQLTDALKAFKNNENGDGGPFLQKLKINTVEVAEMKAKAKVVTSDDELDAPVASP